MMHTRLFDRSTSPSPPKNEEELNDTIDLRLSTNEPLPETRNKACGDTSIAEDVKESCENIIEKTKMQ